MLAARNVAVVGQEDEATLKETDGLGLQISRQLFMEREMRMKCVNAKRVKDLKCVSVKHVNRVSEAFQRCVQ